MLFQVEQIYQNIFFKVNPIPHCSSLPWELPVPGSDAHSPPGTRFFRQLDFPEYEAGFLVTKLSSASWTFNYGRRVSDNEMGTSCS